MVQEEEDFSREPSKVGKKLTELTVQRIILILLTMILIFPFLDGPEQFTSDATLDDEPICSDCDAAQGLSQEGRHSGGDAEPFIVGESSGGAGADVLNMGAATTTAKAPTPKKAAEAAGASGMRSRVGLEFIGD